MGDEWNSDGELDMYELHDAIKASGIDHLNTLTLLLVLRLPEKAVFLEMRLYFPTVGLSLPEKGLILQANSNKQCLWI
jgi:hypothetical protein